MKTLKLIFLIIVGGLFSYSHAQENLNSFSYKVRYIPTGEVANGIDTIYTIAFEMNLKEIKDIAKIYIKIGSAEGTGNKFDYVFAYGKTTGLPAGVKYEIKEDKVILSLGKFKTDTYFYEVQLEDKTGKLSVVKRKTNNDMD